MDPHKKKKGNTGVTDTDGWLIWAAGGWACQPTTHILHYTSYSLWSLLYKYIIYILSNSNT